MRSRMSPIALLLLLACGASARMAHAGLPLESALEWEWETFEAPDLPQASRTVLPREGLETVMSGPGGDAPWLVPGGTPARLAAQYVSPMHASGALRWRAGFAWSDRPLRNWSLDGSVVALALDRAEFYASVERRHWGPGWMGSLILDGAAPALPAVGWRRTADTPSRQPWLRWLGPWTADVFIARLQGHTEPARPQLIGTRLQFEPIPGLEVGLARTMQWGGSGRNEGLRSLLGALIGRDNLGAGGLTQSNEPGNQLAGIDWRWTPDAQRLPSIYGQIVGEDEAGLLPSRNMALLGLDLPLPTRSGSLRLFVEAADTIAGDLGGHATPGAAYRHHVYRQGYTHAGVTLGHPAGGDVRLASLGVLMQRGAMGAIVALSTGRALPQAQRFAAGPVRAANFATHVDLTRRDRLGAGLWWAKDATGRRGEAQWWWQHRH